MTRKRIPSFSHWYTDAEVSMTSKVVDIWANIEERLTFSASHPSLAQIRGGGRNTTCYSCHWQIRALIDANCWKLSEHCLLISELDCTHIETMAFPNYVLYLDLRFYWWPQYYFKGKGNQSFPYWVVGAVRSIMPRKDTERYDYASYLLFYHRYIFD